MPSYREAILEMYDNHTTYDAEEGTRHPRVAQELVDASPLKQGDKVLDVATGTGLVAFAAAKQIGTAGKVIAFNLSESLLAQARQKALGSTVQNVAIFCCEAIVLFERPIEALGIWYNYLKPQGLLAFTCSHQGSYFGPLLKEVVEPVLGSITPNYMHEPLGTGQKIQEALSASGFADPCIRSEKGGRFKPAGHVQCSRRFLSLMFKSDDAVENLNHEQFSHVSQRFETSIAEAARPKGFGKKPAYTSFIRRRMAARL